MSSYLLEAHVVAEAYRDLRIRMIGFLGNQPDSSAGITVPHCPAWTVQMALSHIVGVQEDALSGNMQGVTSEAWTNAQVQRHSHHKVSELLDIWESLAEQVDAMVLQIPAPVNSQFVFDATSHEHDIRCALKNKDARDSMAVQVAEGFVRTTISKFSHLDTTELQEANVSGFDLVRCLSGRRTKAQIQACGLNADLIESIVSSTPMSMPTNSVDE